MGNIPILLGTRPPPFNDLREKENDPGRGRLFHQEKAPAQEETQGVGSQVPAAMMES